MLEQVARAGGRARLPDRSSVCSEVRPSKSDLRSAPMPSPDRFSDPMALTCASVTAAQVLAAVTFATMASRTAG